jgi:hypothetical protein
MTPVRVHLRPLQRHRGLILLAFAGTTWGAAAAGPPPGDLRRQDEPRERGGAAAREAIVAFLRSLDDVQRPLAELPFDHPDRLRWGRGPAARPGISMGDLSQAQRARVHELLAAVLSPRGYERTRKIMQEQDVLGRTEDGMGQDYFWLAVYGRPESGGRWGWRFGGHHLSLHLTYDGDELISITPAFFGTDSVLERDAATGSGLNILAARARLATELLAGLTAEQARQAIVAEQPCSGLVRTEVPRFALEPAEGLPASALTAEQVTRLYDLISDYLADFADPMAAREMQRVRQAPLGGLHFAWAGPRPPSRAPHCYRIQGADFVIEFWLGDGHQHTIWRRTDDFGG